MLSSLIDDSKQPWQFANASFWLYCIWNKYKYHPRDRRGKRTMNLRRVDRAGNVNSRGERLEQEEGTQLDNSVAHGSKGRNFWEETIFRGKEKPPGHDRGIGGRWVPGVLNS